MSTLSGPEDTYKLLVEQSQDNWLYGLVAFAVLEEQRIEWMRHIESRSGSLPSSQQIRDWYQQQPDSVLLRVRGTAENALKVYAEEIAATIEEDYKKDILNDVIVSEIRSSTKFWPQFGANVAAGIVSTLLFSLLLVLLALIVLRDPSPVAMVKQAQEATNGN
ncbi:MULTISPECIES: hypothetical protein [Stenotrophomonas]|jgi:hypothetical protein|uniref:hypothetical protein n=1 Tax=Stenotrophomonas TaxID=40323 RepID=UPI000D4670AB|nr:hypothetical protein [Stenotrophomonas maltophilia]PSD28576.1 hypothetical protein C7E18_01700 [Stenotrophomonas maltophilia]